jgi:hypothetical protein
VTGLSKALLASAIIFALGTVTPAVAKSGSNKNRDTTAKQSVKPKAKPQQGLSTRNIGGGEKSAK